MLKVKKLITQFKVGKNVLSAVDGIDFDVDNQKMVGIVGESGSGKSVTALSIMQLLPNNGSIVSGDILWNDLSLPCASPKEMRAIRGSEIGLIFQNPLAALNPVFTIGNQMTETIRLHDRVDQKQAEVTAIELLRKVSIPDAETRLNDYPHQFSIGMCQRLMIAMTIAMKPKLLIADEPTASLDVTIQAQILALIDSLRVELNMAVLMISHDLGVIAQYCDEILVMYLGKIVEKGTPLQIFKSPQHPYTQALISAIPNPDPSQKHRPELLTGDIPSPLHLPKGCRFHTRCPKVMPQCLDSEPPLLDANGAQSACWLVDQ